MAVTKSTMSFCHTDMETLDDVEDLLDLNGIKKLMLGTNRLTRIGPFNALNCASVLYLDLKNNKIKKIECLAPMINLVYLNLSCNNISKIENLHVVKHLRFLRLDENFIAKIEGLEALVKLEILHLNRNRITTIENVSHLTNLKELKLARNKIKVLENIEGLEKLAYLDISGNAITSLEHVPESDSLTDLIWDSNRVTSLDITTKGKDMEDSAVAFPNLIHLSVCYNKITTKAEILKLRKFYSLQLLELHANSVTEKLGDSLEKREASFFKLLPGVKLNLKMPYKENDNDFDWY